VSILPVIGPFFDVVSKILKKKKFVLWYQGLDAKWVKKSGPMSFRQCRKMRTELVRIGPYLHARFSILREGGTP